jgi:hypothetical protein
MYRTTSSVNRERPDSTNVRTVTHRNNPQPPKDAHTDIHKEQKSFLELAHNRHIAKKKTKIQK